MWPKPYTLKGERAIIADNTIVIRFKITVFIIIMKIGSPKTFNLPRPVLAPAAKVTCLNVHRSGCVCKTFLKQFHKSFYILTNWADFRTKSYHIWSRLVGYAIIRSAPLPSLRIQTCPFEIYQLQQFIFGF